VGEVCPDYFICVRRNIKSIIKVDIQTMDVSCGRFARIYVEIDFNLLIFSQIWIQDR